MKIKVLSFNVQHFENFNTGKIDYDAFAKTIKETGADIIGLNEVRGAGASEGYHPQLEIMAEKLGMYGYFAEAVRFNGVNPYGNAVLSKYPVLSSQTVLIPDPAVKKYDGYYETRCLLKVRIDVAGGLDVFVTHFGLNPDEHENAAKTICSNIGGKCILMGDFNVTPDSCYLDGIRKVLNDTANENEGMFSFPSDKPDKKIDYIFTGDGIEIISAGILPDVVSDHRPYYAELEV